MEGSTWVELSSGVAAAAPTTAAEEGLRTAAAKAVPSAYRSSGSFASARVTTAATGAGTLAGSVGTGCWRCASAVATGVSASKGRRPVRHSNATTPRE